MNEEAPKKPIRSRRERPAKAALNLDVIVRTATDLLSRHGLEGLSLRKVAIELDTGAASLYVYVENLEELHGLVLERALGGLEPPKPSKASWDKRIVAYLEAYFQVLCAVPGTAQIAMTTMSTGPNAMRLTENLLALLDAGGIPETSAAWAVDQLLLHVTAVAAEQTNWRFRDHVVERSKHAYRQAAPEEYPHIHRLGKLMFSGGKDRFRWAIQSMLAGIASTPTPSSTN